MQWWSRLKNTSISVTFHPSQLHLTSHGPAKSLLFQNPQHLCSHSGVLVRNGSSTMAPSSYFRSPGPTGDHSLFWASISLDANKVNWTWCCSKPDNVVHFWMWPRLWPSLCGCSWPLVSTIASFLISLRITLNSWMLCCRLFSPLCSQISSLYSLLSNSLQLVPS